MIHLPLAEDDVPLGWGEKIKKRCRGPCDNRESPGEVRGQICRCTPADWLTLVDGGAVPTKQGRPRGSTKAAAPMAHRRGTGASPVAEASEGRSHH